MKLEVQYWGQAMQTIKLVDNAYESISGHWDREATRKYLGRQISLFLGHKSQVSFETLSFSWKGHFAVIYSILNDCHTF